MKHIKWTILIILISLVIGIGFGDKQRIRYLYQSHIQPTINSTATLINNAITE